jgi:hypothetical protein
MIVNDGNGNVDSTSFVVTLEDTTKPSILCPGDVVTGTDLGDSTAAVNGIPPAESDNCGVVSLTWAMTGATSDTGDTDASGQTFNLGLTIVTYYAEDAAGNIDSCSFTVEVTDDEDP